VVHRRDVTLVLDIKAPTRLVEALGTEAYREALAVPQERRAVSVAPLANAHDPSRAHARTRDAGVAVQGYPSPSR
jgi:hypothetical protein